jgi:hypothetical protein
MKKSVKDSQLAIDEPVGSALLPLLLNVHQQKLLP